MAITPFHIIIQGNRFWNESKANNATSN